MPGIDLNKIIASLVPLLLAAMWWVISSISAIHQDISSLQANMMMLINPQGQIIPSPGNAIERQKLREDLIKEIHEIQVRVSILEKAK
jgi:hypothetical protein